MKKKYTGLKAVRIDLTSGSDLIHTSIPAGCISIWANTDAEIVGYCKNTPSTTIRVWYGNRDPSLPD